MDIAGLKEVTEQSNNVVNWCLCLTGGSVATLLGSIYVRPVGKIMKLSYLLFLLGWIFLGVAFNHGTDLGSEGVRATTESSYIDILVQIRNDYSSQLSYFNFALYTFGAWLFIYLLWWIFSSSNLKKRNHL